jgi:hypothetical protein
MGARLDEIKEPAASGSISDFQAHLAGGAGDDAECGFVVARV